MATFEELINPLSAVAPLTIFEIEHDSLATPFRFVDDTEEITSNGNTFMPLVCRFEFPKTGQIDTSSKLILDNVGNLFAPYITAGGGLRGAILTAAIIDRNFPDTILKTITLYVRDISITNTQLSLTLNLTRIGAKRAVRKVYNRQSFPGLF